MMRRARQNVQTLLDRLCKQNYRFVHPAQAHVPPKENPTDLLDELEDVGVFLPIALRAWIEEVGEVNFMGSSPEWPYPAYLFPDSRKADRVWCTDPLVIGAAPDLIHDTFAEWQWRRNEQGADSAGRFRIAIAPDDLHKANLSGGAPYELAADRLAVDAVLLNERRCVTFVAYLRHSFAWGGFPGFELIDDHPPQAVESLREGLEEF
jgi:hypothetical protein